MRYDLRIDDLVQDPALLGRRLLDEARDGVALVEAIIHTLVLNTPETISSLHRDPRVAALIRQVQQLPTVLRRSLTWDRGLEMAKHKSFTVATKVNVYFCDPQSPWQRGSNENTNGLLRQYLPKGINLSAYSQAKLNAIARQLNERPRKTLNYETPAERFHQSVASIG